MAIAASQVARHPGMMVGSSEEIRLSPWKPLQPACTVTRLRPDCPAPESDQPRRSLDRLIIRE